MADFVTDDAANRRAADGSPDATTRKKGTADGTDSSAGSSVLILP
ncbi:hypothetical protein CCP4SC76_2430003 [Gammaproteobacteria bacterium]